MQKPSDSVTYAVVGKKHHKSEVGEIFIEFGMSTMKVVFRDGSKMRKVVSCEVHGRVNGIVNPLDFNGEGVAILNPKDKFNLEIGKAVAFKCAIKKLSPNLRRDLRDYYFYPLAMKLAGASGKAFPKRPRFYGEKPESDQFGKTVQPAPDVDPSPMPEIIRRATTPNQRPDDVQLQVPLTQPDHHALASEKTPFAGVDY